MIAAAVRRVLGARDAPAMSPRRLVALASLARAAEHGHASPFAPTIPMTLPLYPPGARHRARPGTRPVIGERSCAVSR